MFKGCDGVNCISCSRNYWSQSATQPTISKRIGRGQSVARIVLGCDSHVSSKAWKTQRLNVNDMYPHNSSSTPWKGAQLSSVTLFSSNMTMRSKSRSTWTQNFGFPKVKLFYSVANNIQSIIPVHLTNKENLLLCRRVEDPILATECRAKWHTPR